MPGKHLQFSPPAAKGTTTSYWPPVCWQHLQAKRCHLSTRQCCFSCQSAEQPRLSACQLQNSFASPFAWCCQSVPPKFPHASSERCRWYECLHGPAGLVRSAKCVGQNAALAVKQGRHAQQACQIGLIVSCNDAFNLTHGLPPNSQGCTPCTAGRWGARSCPCQ